MADDDKISSWLEDLELDDSKLQASASAERGDIFLLNWLSEAEKALEKLPEHLVRTNQAKVTAILFNLLTPPALNSSAPFIKPGRPARALIARLFLLLLSRGERKGLFDLGQTLLKGTVGSDAKGAPEREKEWRVASAWCLGEMWAVHGSQVMSLFIDYVQTTTKIYRTTSYSVILRCAALEALRKAILVGGRSMSDQILKETSKALKIGLGDKAGAVVRECAECLLALSATTTAFLTLADIDTVVTPAFRALETADFTTRRSLSLLVAGILASTQVEGSAAPAQPPRKKKPEEEEDDAYPTIGAPTADSVKKTLLSPTEMLSQLSSPYNKPSTSRKLRNGIIDVYGSLFTALGASWVEHYYADVLRHLIDEIACGQAAGSAWSGWNARVAERTEPTKARFAALSARKAVGILLRDIISGRLLSEPGQIMALREVGTLYLRKWPSLMPSQPGPSKQTLIVALDETSGLLRSLGCAPSSVAEALAEPLLRLVSHQSHSVQIAAAWALRTFCDVSPGKISGTIVSIIDLLNKDLTIIGASGPGSSADMHRRAVGHARALAAIINLIPHQALYVSFDLSAKCMSLAIQLLKQSGNHELHISGIEIQVAWIIVSSLMSLGPNFVRLHLPQLLILWRNALPKPTSKDASAAQVRGGNEWAFLLHIRECTLGAILSFLRHNSGSVVTGGVGLLNEDVGRRLVLLLSNGLAFATSFATSHATTLAEQTPSTTSQLQLLDRDNLLRRRLLQCFIALGQNPATQPFQVTLLTQVVTLFSDPEKYIGESALQAVIAAGSGTFTTVWDEMDGYGFGVTSLMKEEATDVAGGEDNTNKKTARLNRDLAEAKIEAQLRISVLGAPENDSLVLSARHLSDPLGIDELPNPPPPASGLVDASIELFALYFAVQESNNQTALLQQILSNVRSYKMEKNPGRRMAVLANSTAAVLGALRQLMHGASPRKTIDVHVGNAMRDIIQESLLHPDSRLRHAAAEALGRLSSLGGTSFMAAQIQFCVSQVVNNTDPDNRAGCALAFGEIYNYVGGLAAGPVLKTIVDVLLSLSADPHPLVHFNALQALSEVIGSASLAYAPFTNSTLGMLCKLYMQDTHEPAGGSPGSVNLRGNLPAYQAICRVTDALIGVLGPELQESERVRDLVLILLREFLKETDDGIIVEAINATQHFLIFAPTAMDLAKLIATLRSQLSSTRQPLKVAAVNSVYQLVQRDAIQMSKLGGDGLVQELFSLLDDDPSIEGVRDAIISWLRQTADVNPSGWIDLCQRIMSRSTGTKVVNDATNAATSSFADEESEGLGIESEGGARPGAAAARTTSRWRTQLFALQCLHEVFVTVQKSGRLEHFDLDRARAVRANRRSLLVTRVADLIKMAFTASTAQVMEIRLEGLVVLRDVIESFSQTRDFDFEEALLLEQYQAPIAAALTPAFAQDSFPEVLASAIQVCAVFVGAGVVKELEKMGRILKLLTNALENCRESDMSSLGDVKDLSSTAAVMLKTSIFAAWAQFQTASVRQPYLVEVIRPHLPVLCPLWVASLREYARVKTDPDATSTTDSGAGGAAFDSVYSGLSRETALPFYERAWPQMLHAVATLVKSNSIPMLRAIDGLDSTTSEAGPLVASTRTTPALFFWVLFGLSFEALCAAPPPSGGTDPVLVQAIALEAVVALIRPDVSGTALVETGLFEELCNLCYRLAITEAPAIKSQVMEIALSLARTFSQELLKSEAGSTNGHIVGGGSSLIADGKMTQCLRVATCVLRESVPSSASSLSRSLLPNTIPSHINLIKTAFTSFADIADIYPAEIREELYSVAFSFYGQLLSDETTEVDLVGPTLPVLKLLCDRAFHVRNGTLAILPKVLNAMLSACLKNIDDVRGRRGIAAGLKTRNNLLATVLLLTGLPQNVKVGQPVVERACYVITQTALGNDSEASTTALHCLTSLLTAGSRGSGVVQFCIGQLLPGLIEYIARAAESDYGINDPKLNSLAEVLKCFVTVMTNIRPENRVQALSILLSVLILLLSPIAVPAPPIHVLALGHLVSIAGSHSVNFKEAAAALDEDQRKILETSIRASVGGGRREEERKEAPKISLKSFG